jgi:hypothetical protein
MIPTGLGMSTRTTFGDQTDTAHSLIFTLHLAGQDSLKLETGEAFARGDKREQISAHLHVHPSDGRDPEHTNDMRYFAGDEEEPSFINFDVSLPASDYSLLLNNIRGGIMPSSVMVSFRRGNGSPIEYGKFPDNSKIIWRNALQQNRRVDVESVEFQYQLIGDVYSDEDTKPPTAKASIDAAAATIVAKLADLEKAFVKGNGWIVTAIIIACAVLYFARQ